MHILVVEPDQILAKTYARALMLAGYSTATARSAQDAVHEADTKMPDVVLLELQLPRHNGVEFLYEFRSYSEWLHIPVVVHSYVPPQEYDFAPTLTNELGVIQFLYKPATSLRKLCAIVAALQPSTV